MINVLISAYSDIIYLLIHFIDLFNIQNLMINVLSPHSDVIHLLVLFINLLYYILNVYGTTLYYY